MSKGLEALRRICLHLVAHDETQHKEFDEYVSVIEQELKALEIVKESGCSLEHILLIEKTKNYDEYDAQFDKYLEARYGPFKFELRKSQEEYDLLKEALL